MPNTAETPQLATPPHVSDDDNQQPIPTNNPSIGAMAALDADLPLDQATLLWASLDLEASLNAAAADPVGASSPEGAAVAAQTRRSLFPPLPPAPQNLEPSSSNPNDTSSPQVEDGVEAMEVDSPPPPSNEIQYFYHDREILFYNEVHRIVMRVFFASQPEEVMFFNRL